MVGKGGRSGKSVCLHVWERERERLKIGLRLRSGGGREIESLSEKAHSRNENSES